MAGFGAAKTGVFGATIHFHHGGPKGRPPRRAGVQGASGAYKSAPSSASQTSERTEPERCRSVRDRVDQHSHTLLRGGVGRVSDAGDPYNTPGALSPQFINMIMSIGATRIVREIDQICKEIFRV